MRSKDAFHTLPCSPVTSCYMSNATYLITLRRCSSGETGHEHKPSPTCISARPCISATLSWPCVSSKIPYSQVVVLPVLEEQTASRRLHRIGQSMVSKWNILHVRKYSSLTLWWLYPCQLQFRAETVQHVHFIGGRREGSLTWYLRHGNQKGMLRRRYCGLPISEYV